ncbi:MAG: flagellar motor protein MotB [Proteobacteria bacterium]|nr:flagellar motor protein MotB [Pseudomonadota bacterium]MBU1709567.1 flagellar motor protein MotB [Pseudomonadota bacterium]
MSSNDRPWGEGVDNGSETAQEILTPDAALLRPEAEAAGHSGNPPEEPAIEASFGSPADQEKVPSGESQAGSGSEGADEKSDQEDPDEHLPTPFVGDGFQTSFNVYAEDDTFYRSRMPKPFHWSVVWSDLMMTMFIMFAVMYIFQLANRDFLSEEETSIGRFGGLGEKSITGLGGGGPIDPSGPLEGSISKMYDVSRQTLEAADLREFASVDLAADKTLRIILTGDLLFEPGRADLKSEAKKSLVKIADLIRRTSYMINVVGHTDSVPIHTPQFSTNWELSVVRASSVARFLIEEMRLPGNRFFVTGHSYYQPISPNDTPKNRALNRRVEIIITREPSEPLPVGLRNIYEQ